MGLFKNLRDQVKAASSMAAEIRAATPPGGAPPGGALVGSSAPAPSGPDALHILNPTPQHRIDELWRNGVVRGVVTGARHDMSDGDRPIRTKVHVRVRQRLAGGGLGPEMAFTAWVGWKVAALLEPGLEVPLEVDRSSGAISGLSTGELADELKPRSDEARRRHRGFDVETGLEGVGGLAGALRDFAATPSATMPDDGGVRADDPALMPIEGVTFDQVVEARALLRATSAPMAQWDVIAQQFGVPAGRWADIENAWLMRTWTNPGLAHRYGVALEQAEARRRMSGR